MAENSKIEWCDHTFNPWSGCSKVHEGCAHCYAEVNYSVKMRGVKWGPNGTRVKTANWKEPLKWNRQAEAEGVRKRVFCASLADVFEDWQGPIHDHKGQRCSVRDAEPVTSHGRDLDKYPMEGWQWATMADLRRDLFALIDATPHLDWLLLTKRPENIRRMWCSHVNTDGMPPSQLHRPNVWLGTSISNQATAEKYASELTVGDIAPVLFWSIEPLLGPIDLNKVWRNARLPDWVIIGGESGPNARVCHTSWMSLLVSQCRAAGVKVFVKQLGARPVGASGFREASKGSGGPLKMQDSKGGDWSEWPEDLRVREMPTT